jgi:hypothetical protein
MDLTRYLNKLDMNFPARFATAKRICAQKHLEMEYISTLSVEQWLHHPVVFRPRKDMVEAFSHVEIGLRKSEYRQPYDSILIDYPDGECSICSIVPFRGHKFLCINHSTGVPDAKGGKYTLAMMIDGEGILPDGRAAKVIEDVVESTWDLPVNDYTQRQIPMNRVAINCCLMLANEPTRRVRTERERILMRIAKGSDRKKAFDAKQKLKLHPQVIDFVNPPKVYDSYGTQTDITKRPHWRRGHWRNQACGPAWKDHRLVFIRPVLIHADAAESTTNEMLYLGR